MTEPSASRADPSGTGPTPRPDPDGPLSVRHLRVRRGGKLVLDDVSFDVPRGALVAVVGPNGAGKTTLLRALLGLVPYEGEIRWPEGVRIGYVPQKLVDTDVPLTVREFLAMKCPGEYGECLASTGLRPAILDHSLGVLSGGELQRVLIAWAIVDHPQVLLFDEPTSNVDTGSEEVILETLRRVQRTTGVTLLLVTHEVHAMHHLADRVLALDRTVLYSGSSADLLADPRLMRVLFGTDHDHSPHASVGEDAR